MSHEIMRTHIVIEKDLVDSVDRLVGRRGRSQFFAEAVADKLTRARLAAVARKAVGSLADADIPGWETSDPRSNGCTLPVRPMRSGSGPFRSDDSLFARHNRADWFF
jgi:hypothetical protein